MVLENLFPSPHLLTPYFTSNLALVITAFPPGYWGFMCNAPACVSWYKLFATVAFLSKTLRYFFPCLLQTEALLIRRHIMWRWWRLPRGTHGTMLVITRSFLLIATASIRTSTIISPIMFFKRELKSESGVFQLIRHSSNQRTGKW